MNEKLDSGGLMRCCTGSWDEAMDLELGREWVNGDIIECRYLPGDIDHRIVRRDGIWGWDHE